MSNSYEVPKVHRTVEEIFADVELNVPNPIASSVPANVDEQKSLFLAGEKHNPEFIYDKLESYNFSERRQKLLELKEKILSHPAIVDKQSPVYEALIDRQLKILYLMEVANQYNLTDSANDKKELAVRFRNLNLDLYGAADRVTTLGLIAEKKKSSRKGMLIRQLLILVLSF